MKKYNIIILILISIQLNLLGQDKLRVPKKFNSGYIITNSGDTLLGYVNYRDYPYLRFMDLNGKRKTYTASKIKGFSDLDLQRKMESFYINHKDNVYFLERIETGKHSLYLNYENVAYNYDPNAGLVAGAGFVAIAVLDGLYSNKYISAYYFTKNDTLECIPRAKKQFRNSMMKHFSDCKYVINKIESDSLHFKDLHNIFKIINEN